MLEKYREKLHSLILLKAFFTKERSSNLSVSFKDKIWALKHGFLSESNVIYQLDKSNFKFYLSDYDRLKTSLINGKYSTLLDDKVVFENLMNKYLNLPESIAYVNDGRIISINDSYNINSYDSFLDYLLLKKQLVIKPISGGGGKGVLILKVSSSKIYLNSKEISKKELFNTFIAKLDKNFISEFIVQGRYGEILYPHTTNTIRIVTMLAPNNHKPFIPIAVQRIGNERSIPSDNWTQGGLSVAIDLDTGELSRGIMYPSNGELKVYDRHTDTGQKFKGGVVPNWDLIKNEILNAASKIPFIHYIGWDVVITDDGYKVIEANNYSDVNLLQVHQPLLRDDRVLEFFKYHGII